ncbi:response regulator [Candidatus Omnitrophota bacterium]
MSPANAKKVLVIDDEIKIIRMVRLRLEAAQYIVTTASDGEEGLEKLKQEKPDLIILDVMMPKLGGYEFITKMKEDAAVAATPVIVLTGNPRMKELFAMEGVRDYIVKPFVGDELLEKVRNSLPSTGAQEAGRLILIIDDEPAIVKMLGMRLKALGYNVDSAENGAVGLEKVKTLKPHLIVLDIMMPVMDGFEFFKVIRKDPEHSHIPIIILTARGAMKDVFESMGVVEFVPKPFDAAQLSEKINLLLTDHAVIVSQDLKLIEPMKNIFDAHKYDTHIVTDELAMMETCQKIKSKFVFIHLPFIQPNIKQKDFIEKLRKALPAQAKVVIYCDSRVKGTEDNDMVIIDEIKHMWLRAGADTFFDPRVESIDFFREFNRFVYHNTEGPGKVAYGLDYDSQ